MASTSLPSSPEPGTDGLPRTPNAARLARKRATDRRSQRNHRERRRAYVRDLEETVASLRDASSADERVATLTAQNEALRARCQALVTQLQRIRSITNESTPRTRMDPQSPSPSNPCDVGELTDNLGLSISETPTFFYDHLEPINDSSANAVLNVVVPTVQSPTCDEMTEETFPGLPGEAQTLQEVPSLSIFTLERQLDDFLMEDTISCSLSPPLPEYARPQGAADRLLHAMLEEAIAEHQAGKFDTSKPSLNRLLAHGPVDLLSFRLFHYINQYGAMPMHWMLAIFWVQYLFLRVRSPEPVACAHHT